MCHNVAKILTCINLFSDVKSVLHRRADRQTNRMHKHFSTLMESVIKKKYFMNVNLKNASVKTVNDFMDGLVDTFS